MAITSLAAINLNQLTVSGGLPAQGVFLQPRASFSARSPR